MREQVEIRWLGRCQTYTFAPIFTRLSTNNHRKTLSINSLRQQPWIAVDKRHKDA
jgi:hypothetical protein